MKVFVLKNENSKEETYLTVYQSIITQIGIDIDIEEVFFPIPDNGLKWKPLAKQFCKKIMLETGDPYTIINDREFRNLYNNNYYEMRDFLEKNKSYGAISLRAHSAPPPEFDHICVGAVMFRREALEQTQFDMYPKDSSCSSVRRSLYNNGWNFGYLNGGEIRCEKL